MRHLVAALCLLSAPALAQSNPSFITGQIPTAAQWNSYFGKKADVTGGTINNGVLNSVTINGSLGGSPTVGGVWTASNATLSGFAITGGSLGGSITGTGATITGGTFSGITLGGTIPGSPTLSGNWTWSGNITAQGFLTLGTNTTGRVLALNGATGSQSSIAFRVAGVGLHTLGMDSSSNLNFKTCDSGGANCNTWLQVAATTGLPTFDLATNIAAPFQINPGTITVSGSDAGTPGVSQGISNTTTYAGSTTVASAFIANQTLANVNLVATNANVGFTVDRIWAKFGGAAFNTTGVSVLNAELDTNADMPAQTGSPAFVAFFPKVVAQHNIAAQSYMEASNPACNIKQSTGFSSGIVCEEIDWYSLASASPIVGNTGLFLSNHSEVQGHFNDSYERYSSALPDTTRTVGARDLWQFGSTGNQNPINYNNGAILSAYPQAAANFDASAVVPMGGLLGFDLNNFSAAFAVFRSPGFRVLGAELDAGNLSVTQATNGPLLDATQQRATAAVWVSGTGFQAGEQLSDRIGGNWIISTVDGSGTPTALTQANSQPTYLRSGQVTVVARAWAVADSASGSTLLNFASGGQMAQVGDALVAPTTAGAVAGGTTIASFTTQKTLTTNGTNTTTSLPFASVTGITTGGAVVGYCIAPNTVVASQDATHVVLSIAPRCTIPSGIVITFLRAAVLSAALTGTIPANSPVYFTLTGIPSNPIVLIGGSGKSGTANYTWSTPTQLQIGATVNTLIGPGSALATNATSGMLLIPSMAGPPTGNVGALGGVALNYDSTNKKLCVTIGATVECSGAFTP